MFKIIRKNRYYSTLISPTPAVEALTDTFGRFHDYLRISLSERCNLRCNYCMPAEGVKLTPNSDILTTDEIIHLAKIFANEGVTKIRLTGGEPTVRKDLTDIITRLSDIDQIKTIAMTTNGLTLTRQLVKFQRAGLNMLNISLDTLKPDRFVNFTRRKGWERVMAGINLALQLEMHPVKVNCVVMRNQNDDEICDFVQLTKDKPLDVRFIEYMPFTGNKWNTKEMVPLQEMLTIIKKKWSNFEALPNGANDTSKAYKVPGFAGQVGFITSMSQHFCDSCNRLRLTADGNLKVCLFGNREVSLRDAIRNNQDVVPLINAAVKRKKKQHAVLQIQFHRHYSTQQLTHIDDQGNPTMVNIRNKPITTRAAHAQATIQLTPEICKQITENKIKKGNVLTIAEIAGIIGAKKTYEIIPLCHNINLSQVLVRASLIESQHQVVIDGMVECEGKTGVEMEALTAVTTAALTIYDMCKKLSKEIVISNIHLIEKTGGTGGDYRKKIALKFDHSKLDSGKEIHVFPQSH